MRPTILKIICIVVLLTIGVAWLVNHNYFKPEKEPIHVAFAGPMSGEGAMAGKLMTQAIQLYLDTINKNGGVHGRKIIFDIFDDRNHTKEAKTKAIEIVRKNQAVAVIGHWYSSTSISAGEIYKKYGIPAITPGSTNINVTKNNPWYFRNIFNANASGQFLANYVKQVLQQNTVSIIHESDAYGAYLAQVFAEACQKQGMTVNYQWQFDNNARRLDYQFDKIVEELQKKSDAGVIFLAVQASEGIKIVKLIKDASIPNILISETSFSEQTFIHGFDEFPREQANPGFYTNDIYVATPLIFDTANEQAQQFREAYQAKYHEEPDWSAAYAYDTVMLLVEAMKQTKVQGLPSTLAVDRENIRNFLAGRTDVNEAIVGVTGFNYFDSNRDALKPISIGVYKHKNIISALTQLQLINQHDKILNLEKGFEKDQVLYIDDKYMYKTNVVYAGVKLNEVTELDLDKFTYLLDFDLWFRFQGHDINPENIDFLNAAEPIVLGSPIVDEEIEKITYRVYRVKGRFKADFLPNFHTFKQHVLGLSFRHRDFNRNHLIYVTDFLGMGLTKGQSLIEKVKTAKVLSPVYNWGIQEAWVFQDTQKEDSLGNPKYLNVHDGIVEYSRFNVGILIKKEEFSILNMISVLFMEKLFIFSSVGLIFLTILIHHPKFQTTTKLLWVVRVLFAFLWLFAGEAVLIDWLAEKTSNSVLEGLIKVFNALWWIILAHLINRALESFIWTPLEEKTGRLIPNIVRRFVSFLIYLLAFFAIVAFVYERALTSLLATSGVIAMIIGLAIQINISNIFSGIALNIERPLRVGDWVKIGDFEEGKVLDINWRATRLHMRDGSTFSIPNSLASETTIRNYSFPEQYFWLWPTVYVDSIHPPERVEKILLDAVLSVKGIVKDPKPMIIFEGINEWAAAYWVVVCADDYDNKPLILQEVWKRIWIHLNRAGINPAVQQHKIHIFRGVKERGEEAAQRLTLLQEIDIFQPFSEKAKLYLSKRMRSLHVSAGQTIVHQGEAGDSLFIIVEGTVSVQIIKGGDQKIIEVARLGAGNFFGEMALLTGQERTATIVALNETILFEIIKADILPLLQRQPEVSKMISKVLTERQLMTKTKMGNLSQDSQVERDVIYKRLLRGIRDFFGLGNTSEETNNQVKALKQT